MKLRYLEFQYPPKEISLASCSSRWRGRTRPRRADEVGDRVAAGLRVLLELVHAELVVHVAEEDDVVRAGLLRARFMISCVRLASRLRHAVTSTLLPRLALLVRHADPEAVAARRLDQAEHRPAGEQQAAAVVADGVLLLVVLVLAARGS